VRKTGPLQGKKPGAKNFPKPRGFRTTPANGAGFTNKGSYSHNIANKAKFVKKVAAPKSANYKTN
jgi:hypothetical protein